MAAKFYQQSSIVKAVRYSGENEEEIIEFLKGENAKAPVSTYFDGRWYVSSDDNQCPAFCLSIGINDYVIQRSDSFDSLSEHKFKKNYKEIM